MDYPSFFAIIPASVRYAQIPPSAKLLYGEITALTASAGYCYASNSYFAKLYDVSERCVIMWLKHLEKGQFIRIDFDQNNTSKRHIFIADMKVNSYLDVKKSSPRDMKIFSYIIIQILIIQVIE